MNEIIKNKVLKVRNGKTFIWCKIERISEVNINCENVVNIVYTKQSTKLFFERIVDIK